MIDCNLEDNNCIEKLKEALNEFDEIIKELPKDNILYNQSEILKAISDPLRLKILYLLKNGELCACHIDCALDKPQSTISHHLNILKRSNLLNWRKEGKWTYFSLSNPKLIEQIENMTKTQKGEISLENNSICCESEEIIGGKKEKEKEEGCGCGCGSFVRPDQSKIDNPQNPKKEIENDTLKKLEKKSKKFGIKSIGYAKIPENILNENHDLQYSNAIVITSPIGMDIIDEIPGEKAQELNNKLYEKFGNISYELSDYLRSVGFATQVAHPEGELIDLSRLGQVAGLGDIGKNGLLITPELGPRLKVSAILTSIKNLPILKKNNHKWIKNYCEVCGKCIKGCPENALIENDNNLTKADIIDEKCIGCSQGCTYCIESCPFFEKGYDWVKEKINKMKIE
ncbi:MAG: metalloregulator ArsR/SmtB family transcription factor [Methanobrevibacter sp.]|nr:metalloregulator ArsR/SmtB family transcription factor [Methanobrevibacter sp.]